LLFRKIIFTENSLKNRVYKYSPVLNIIFLFVILMGVVGTRYNTSNYYICNSMIIYNRRSENQKPATCEFFITNMIK
jgi:hypothetical protein